MTPVTPFSVRPVLAQTVLSARMRFVVGLFQTFDGDMSINLRRGKVGMPEQGLDAAQIGSVFQEMRRKAMAQFVGADR